MDPEAERQSIADLAIPKDAKRKIAVNARLAPKGAALESDDLDPAPASPRSLVSDFLEKVDGEDSDSDILEFPPRQRTDTLEFPSLESVCSPRERRSSTAWSV